MSRKQSGKHVRKKCELEKKKTDKRAGRRTLTKDQKNLPQGEDEFLSFSKQLQALGLQLREVQGDGNCLFRALADQMEGHSRNHLRLREETVQYMMTHRQDFEPFVEDDVPFTKHVLDLAEPGTFAGNDAIVAFARSQQVKVVIHQLNAPLWEINGSEKPLCPELHIAYRYGDHYDSVRHVADNSKGPAHLRIANLNNSRQFGDGNKDIQKAPFSPHSLYDDEEVILNPLTPSMNSKEKNLSQSSAISQKGHAESLESEPRNQSSACDLGTEKHPKNLSKQSDHACLAGGTTNQPKVSNKQRKEQQRLEKKKKQEERHRQKILQSIGSHDQNQNLPDTFTLVPAFNTLSI
ncbi:OTU domain-containing protein 3 [Bagarius yarrelli]|uniref:OTU domain-containing protein 3 n=1 Tax=Bagarius yarrelli TaxID=175774 RepID=A0A556V1L7_BAGYA|nr:OTU domain-containing protein 3 [Bagarius yarrelli]